MLSELGAAAMVKSGCCCAVTLNVTVVVGASPPPLAVTVSGYVPTGVLVPTMIVMVEVPPPGAGIVLGLKLTVVPAGAPVADRLTALLNPPLMLVVMVVLP